MTTQNYTEQEAQERFHEFFQSEYKSMLRYASYVLSLKSGRREELRGRAEEAVQETFAFAWERRAEVLASEKPVGWLYNALCFKAQELIKAENRWTKRLLKYAQYYNPRPQAYLSLEVELGDLVPKEDFELLCRVYINGCGYRELCKELNVTKSALAVRLFRIKERIRKQLTEK